MSMSCCSYYKPTRCRPTYDPCSPCAPSRVKICTPCEYTCDPCPPTRKKSSKISDFPPLSGGVGAGLDSDRKERKGSAGARVSSTRSGSSRVGSGRGGSKRGTKQGGKIGGAFDETEDIDGGGGARGGPGSGRGGPGSGRGGGGTGSGRGGSVGGPGGTGSGQGGPGRGRGGRDSGPGGTDSGRGGAGGSPEGVTSGTQGAGGGTFGGGGGGPGGAFNGPGGGYGGTGTGFNGQGLGYGGRGGGFGGSGFGGFGGGFGGSGGGFGAAAGGLNGVGGYGGFGAGNGGPILPPCHPYYGAPGTRMFPSCAPRCGSSRPVLPRGYASVSSYQSNASNFIPGMSTPRNTSRMGVCTPRNTSNMGIGFGRSTFFMGGCAQNSVGGYQPNNAPGGYKPNYGVIAEENGCISEQTCSAKPAVRPTQMNTSGFNSPTRMQYNFQRQAPEPNFSATYNFSNRQSRGCTSVNRCTERLPSFGGMHNRNFVENKITPSYRRCGTCGAVVSNLQASSGCGMSNIYQPSDGMSNLGCCCGR